MKRMLVTKWILFTGSFLLSVNVVGQLLYQHAGLSLAERTKDLVSRLTLEEKASRMFGQSPARPRLGIKKLNWWSVALPVLISNDSVAAFPEPVGGALSSVDELVYKIYHAVSEETRAQYHAAVKSRKENRRFLRLSACTPNVNIFRDPRPGSRRHSPGDLC